MISVAAGISPVCCGFLGWFAVFYLCGLLSPWFGLVFVVLGFCCKYFFGVDKMLSLFGTAVVFWGPVSVVSAVCSSSPGFSGLLCLFWLSAGCFGRVLFAFCNSLFLWFVLPAFAVVLYCLCSFWVCFVLEMELV